MGAMILDHILVTPLKRISVPGGDVLHALKCTDDGFKNFGEAYFSMVEFGAVKAWKRHLRMTLNLVVPVGRVGFIFCLDGADEFQKEEIGVDRYARITVPPGVWFGFKGLAAPQSLVLNIASIPHDPNEVEGLAISTIKYDWR